MFNEAVLVITDSIIEECEKLIANSVYEKWSAPLLCVLDEHHVYLHHKLPFCDETRTCRVMAESPWLEWYYKDKNGEIFRCFVDRPGEAKIAQILHLAEKGQVTPISIDSGPVYIND